MALIVNPAAAGGRAGRALGPVQHALAQRGCKVEVYHTERPGHAGQLAQQAATAGPCAIATLGGDGTLNEAVQGLVAGGAWPDQVTITPIPVGTANSFARDFGLQTGDWQAAVERLVSGQSRQVDVASISLGRESGGAAGNDAAGSDAAGAPARLVYSVNVFGTGFMAAVAATTNRRMKRFGELGYSLAVFWELARLAPVPTRLTIGLSEAEGDARTIMIEAPLILVAVCNSQWTGDRMWIAPQADPADGALDVLTLGAISRLELVRLFGRIFSGRHRTHRAVNEYRVRRITIEPLVDGPLLIDGEVYGSTPVTVEVVPGAITVGL